MIIRGSSLTLSLDRSFLYSFIHHSRLPIIPSEFHVLSPRILRASCRSLGMMVTRLAWIAHRFVSSKSPTRYDSAASCSARTAWLWNLRSLLYSWAISLTRRWKGSFLIKSSVYKEVRNYRWKREKLRWPWKLKVLPCGSTNCSSYSIKPMSECLVAWWKGTYRFLESSDLPQSNGARSESVGPLDAAARDRHSVATCGLASGLARQLLARGLTSSVFPCCLLRACHLTSRLWFGTYWKVCVMGWIKKTNGGRDWGCLQVKLLLILLNNFGRPSL